MFFDDLESKLVSDQEIYKSILRDVKCPVHKLKACIIYDYDNDFTYAHITKCCCPQFAQIVANTIRKTETIDIVVIDDCEYTRWIGQLSHWNPARVTNHEQSLLESGMVAEA